MPKQAPGQSQGAGSQVHPLPFDRACVFSLPLDSLCSPPREIFPPTPILSPGLSFVFLFQVSFGFLRPTHIPSLPWPSSSCHLFCSSVPESVRKSC